MQAILKFKFQGGHHIPVLPKKLWFFMNHVVHITFALEILLFDIFLHGMRHLLCPALLTGIYMLLRRWRHWSVPRSFDRWLLSYLIFCAWFIAGTGRVSLSRPKVANMSGTWLILCWIDLCLHQVRLLSMNFVHLLLGYYQYILILLVSSCMYRFHIQLVVFHCLKEIIVPEVVLQWY